MSRVSSFDPVLPDKPGVLILGSMPGVASLRQQQYYAHPRNLFWQIIGRMIACDSQQSYACRIAALQRAGIALWDVFRQCERDGSLDTAIQSRNVRINAIDNLLHDNPTIAAVFFNGKKATDAFGRYVLPVLAPPVKQRLKIIRLPSTSPANAGITLAQKQQAWQQIQHYITVPKYASRDVAS